MDVPSSTIDFSRMSTSELGVRPCHWEMIFSRTLALMAFPMIRPDPEQSPWKKLTKAEERFILIK